MVPQGRHPRVAAAVRGGRQAVAVPLPLQRLLQTLRRGLVAAQRAEAPEAQALQLRAGHRGGDLHITWMCCLCLDDAWIWLGDA